MSRCWWTTPLRVSRSFRYRICTHAPPLICHLSGSSTTDDHAGRHCLRVPRGRAANALGIASQRLVPALRRRSLQSSGRLYGKVSTRFYCRSDEKRDRVAQTQIVIAIVERRNNFDRKYEPKSELRKYLLRRMSRLSRYRISFRTVRVFESRKEERKKGRKENRYSWKIVQSLELNGPSHAQYVGIMREIHRCTSNVDRSSARRTVALRFSDNLFRRSISSAVVFLQISHVGDPPQCGSKLSKLHTLLLIESLLSRTFETRATPENRRKENEREATDSLLATTIERPSEMWNIRIVILTSLSMCNYYIKSI